MMTDMTCLDERGGRGTDSSASIRERVFDVAIVGAGPAGLAAAVAARGAGAERVVVLEREGYAGGVLPQCVHDGFGLHVFGESLTGPEYAREWACRAQETGALIALSTTVLSVDEMDRGEDFRLDVIGRPFGGHVALEAKSVVVASGCRERTRGALGIAGTRPAGVMTAGTAQYLMNVKNLLPGDKAVILGSGDIGLIMARRLTLEGCEVRLVLGAEGTGLLRNHIRCIEDFGLPIRYGWGVASIHGRGRLKGVTIAPLNEDGSFDMDRKEYLRCNLLLLACGLIPEREVLKGVRSGIEGLFVCGNADAPCDLVDQVTQAGVRAGETAARFAAAATGATVRELDAELSRMRDMRIEESKGRVSEVETGARSIACTVCPKGCVISVDDEGIFRGSGCSRGEDYARSEIVRPMRTFTGTVKCSGAPGREAAVLMPVRTSADVPRDSLMDVARACRRIRVNAPIAAGDVLVRNVAGTRADLIACQDA